VCRPALLAAALFGLGPVMAGERPPPPQPVFPANLDVVNVALNLILIPAYGIMGAAVATVAAYVVMFLGMTWYAQLVFPVPYQWRRVLTAVAAALALLLVGRQLGGFAAALGLSLAYPLALLLLGFFLPEERRSLLARVGR